MSTIRPLLDPDAHATRIIDEMINDDRSTMWSDAFMLAPVGMAIVTLDGTFAAVNAALCTLVGRDRDTLVGRRFYEVGYDGTEEDLQAALKLRDGELDHYRAERRWADADGIIGWLLLQASIVRPQTGEPFAVVQLVDITERKLTEAALTASERRFRTLATHTPNGVFLMNAQGRVRWANERMPEIFGRPLPELLGEGWKECVHPSDREATLTAALDAWRSGEQAHLHFRTLWPDGTERWAHAQAGPVTDRDGVVTAWVGAVEDETRERDARQELAMREAEFRMLAEHSSDFLARHAPDGAYRYASPAAHALLGIAPEDLVGRSPLDFADARDVPLLRDELARAARGGRATVSYRMRCGDGDVRWFESSLRGVRVEGFDEAHATEIVAVTRDISRRKEAELELTRMAMRDALTGLPNRTLFRDRLDLALQRSHRRRPASVAVYFLDLDRFKLVNDSLGHAVGDELLCEVARRLREVLRPGDTVARFGGDEFTILCEEVIGELEAVAIAQRIVDVFKEPFELGDGAEELFVNTSVGIALSGARDDSADGLLRDADAAMYRAKELGRGRFELFDAAMRAHARERLDLENALRRVVDRNELVLHYQPMARIDTGEILAFEALVRWEHPERGMLYPDAFIPLAEESGTIVALGAWALHQACADAAKWRGSDRPKVGVSVNVSPRQVVQPGFVGTVRRALQATGLPGNALWLELTETAVMTAGPALSSVLAELKTLGVHLAIDDFGAGYTSLSHLRRFPIDVLKLDKAFVHGLGQDHRDVAIAQAVIGLARGLGMTTVAEGIETAAQRDILAELGCDVGQGWLLAPAQPSAEALALLGAPLQAG